MAIVKPLTVSPGAPKQYNQSSRKGKKAWRKNIDVTEVEQGLEDVRDEEILGGVLAEKASADLFTLDATGDASVQKTHLKGSKPLRADEILAQRSAVPAVPMRKRPSSKVTDGVVEPREKRHKADFVSRKEISRLRDIADGKAQSGVDESSFSYDPWAMADDSAADPRFTFLEKPKKKVVPVTMKQKPISLAANGRDIPAVKKPQGGTSYNPSFEEYQEAYIAAGDGEVAAERKRQAEEELEAEKAAARERSAAEADAAEARAALSEWEEDSAWEGFESAAEEAPVSLKRPPRKTQTQKNKIKRRKEEEQKAKMAANDRRRREQIEQAKELAALYEEKQRQRAVAVPNDDSSEEGDDDHLRRRKLGKMMLPQKDLELVLPDELQESLRLLKPEGNLLKDRYRNFVVRGKFEARRHIPFAKKAKTKVTEKWSHKDFVLH